MYFSQTLLCLSDSHILRQGYDSPKVEAPSTEIMSSVIILNLCIPMGMILKKEKFRLRSYLIIASPTVATAGLNTVAARAELCPCTPGPSALWLK